MFIYLYDHQSLFASSVDEGIFKIGRRFQHIDWKDQVLQTLQVVDIFRRKPIPYLKSFFGFKVR